MHLIKTKCVDVAGLAAMLYSSSKLLRLASSLNGVRDGIFDIISTSLRIVQEPGPERAEDTELWKVAHRIFNIDGDCTCLYVVKKGKKEPTTFLKQLQQLCLRVRFDWELKRWFYFAWTHEEASCPARRRARVTMEDAVTDTTIMLSNIMLGKAWPIAALARWTHVVEGLKRMVFGAAAGGILIRALATLDKRMAINAPDVERNLQRAAQERAEGREVNDGWHKHCARVLRVARFWADTEKSWRSGVVLVSVCTIDILAKHVLGHNHTPANLSDLVDPSTSQVARTTNQCLDLLAWAADGPFALLRFLGAPTWRTDAAVRQCARRQLIGLSCGIYRRLTLRYQDFPYKLQWLISPGVPNEDKEGMLQDFFDRPEGCMTPGVRRLRALLSQEAWAGRPGRQAVSMLQKALTFSTHPVEVDHKQCRDDVSSSTTGASVAFTAGRAQVRHFRAAHREKGNADAIASSAKMMLTTSAPPLALTDGEAVAVGARSGDEDVRAGEEPHPARPLQEPNPNAARIENMENLGGGNPKMMYINWRIRQATSSSAGDLSFQQLNEMRKKLARDYDESDALKLRWRWIFKSVQTRRRVAKPAEEPQTTIIAAQPLWPESRPADANAQKHAHLPFHPELVVDHFQQNFKTMASLTKASLDPSPYVMDTAAVPDRCAKIVGGWGPLFGCKCEPANRCKESVPIGHLEAFIKLRAALVNYVDTVKLKIATEEFWFTLVGRRGDERPLHVFAFFGSCSFKPKVQTFIRCSPDGEDDCTARGFSTEARDVFPWVLKMERRASPLTLANDPKFYELHHETSDDLCYRLVVEVGEGYKWHLRRLATEEIAEQDLKHVRITGWDGDEVLLEPTARTKVFNPDLHLAWLRLNERPRGALSGHRGAAAPPPPLARADGQAQDAGVHDAMVGADDHEGDGILPEAELASAIVESGAIGEGIDDLFDDLVEEMYAELSGVAAESELAGALPPQGADAQEGEAICSADVQNIFAQQIAVVDPEGDAMDVEGAAPDDAPAMAPPIEEDVGNGDANRAPAIVMEVSPKGFVTSPSPPFDGITLGRVTWFKQSISARCHLHHNCTCIKTLLRADLETMKSWLARGEVVPIGSPVALYDAARARHQASRP